MDYYQRQEAYTKFFRGIQRAMQAHGFKVEYDYTGRDNIVVNECCFYAEEARTRIKFLGWNFPRPYDSPKIIGQAVKLILDVLPERIEEEARAKKQRARQQEAEKVNRALPRGAFVYATSDEKFALDYQHAEKLTVMAAVDCLQDNGFFDSPIPSNEDDFYVRRMIQLWRGMTPEQQAAFLENHLNGEQLKNITNTYLTSTQN